MVGEVGLRAANLGVAPPGARTDRNPTPAARASVLERVSSGLDRAGAKDIAATLQSAKDGFQSQGKEIARQKVELIKERIKALKLIARADPQAVARLAARLAKELDAAVKSYVEAGGTAAIAAGANVPTPAAASKAADEQGTGGADAEPGSPAPARPPEATLAPHAAVADAGGKATQTDITAKTSQATAGDGDRAFIDLARDLLKDLQKVLEVARQHLSLTGSRDADRDMEEADKAIRETAKSLDHLAAGRPPVTPRLDVLA